MRIFRSIFVQSAIVLLVVLGTCMAFLLAQANNRILSELEAAFLENSLETTGFIAAQINTGTRLKRGAMIEPQLNALLNDDAIPVTALRVTHVEGIVVSDMQDATAAAGSVPTFGDADFSMEPSTTKSDGFAIVRTPILLGSGADQILVGELVVAWDKSDYLAKGASVTSFLRTAFLIMAAIVLAVMLLGIHLVIVRPVAATARVLKDVSGGADDVKLPAARSAEIGAMVGAVEQFFGP